MHERRNSKQMDIIKKIQLENMKALSWKDKMAVLAKPLLYVNFPQVLGLKELSRYIHQKSKMLKL